MRTGSHFSSSLAAIVPSVFAHARQIWGTCGYNAHMKPTDTLTAHFRLTPVQIAALRRLGVLSVEDLLRHFPSRYERAGASARTTELVPGTKVTLFGTLTKLKAKKLWKSRGTATTGTFEDGSGKVNVMWFNQPYIASYVPEGSHVKMTGTVGGKAARPYIANPEVELVPAGSITGGLFETENAGQNTQSTIFPIYPESRGVTSLWFFHALKRVFSAKGGSASGGEKSVLNQIEDPIPDTVREKYHLPDIATALHYIHAPGKEAHAEAARKRFAFEEIFVLQAARARDRALNDTLSSFPIANDLAQAAKFLDSTDLEPTMAQKRTIEEIVTDFTKPPPMARLLEGDVGAGKTLVAAATAYAVVTSRPPGRVSGTLQVAYMAPTEILAGQHFQSFIEYFKELPINIALITGSGCKKFPSKVSRDHVTDISRAQLLKWVANGEIAMVIGTHALIQKSVKFQHLAYAIVDEQHRFGTQQRRAQDAGI